MRFSKGLDLTFLFVNLYQDIFDVSKKLIQQTIYDMIFYTTNNMVYSKLKKKKSVKGMDDVSRDENNPCFSVNWRKFCT